ncbi:MAG: molybdenum cofactor guanylyltransferase [Bacteroidales bacterium]|nr:molybdenum cofactor guanylyltransferase [Bacteroidales bacterium]
MKLSAAILTGGESSRMGGDNKAFAEVGGISVFERQHFVLSKIFEQTIICGKNVDYGVNLPIFPDKDVGNGPVSGIYSALANSTTDYVFISSCDMPFLNTDLIKDMMEIVINSNYDIVIPIHPQGIEPLHAFYSTRLTSLFKKQLDEKEFRIRKNFENLNIHYFDVNLRYNPNVVFMNINTQEDLKKANDYERENYGR